jgi:DNA-binding transcriptional LysR family regulator
LELGVPLFANLNNKLVATQAGRHFYQVSRAAVKEFSALEQDVAQQRLKQSGIIALGEGRGSSDVLSRAEASVMAELPYVEDSLEDRLRIVEGTTYEIREQVLSEQIAYGHIIATSIDESLFDYEVIRSGRIRIAMRDDDPLADCQEIDIRDLRDRRWSTEGKGFDVAALLMRRAQDAGFTPSIYTVQSALADRVRVVETGYSLTYVYDDRTFPKVGPHVTSRPLSDPTLCWTYCVIAKKGMGDPHLMNYFSGKEGRFAEAWTAQAPRSRKQASGD